MGGGSSNGSSPVGTNDLYPSIEKGLFARLIKKKKLKLKKKKKKKRKKGSLYTFFVSRLSHDTSRSLF